jgi:hypothetical protein
VWYQATFDWPVAIAVDKSENVYVADFGTHKIRKIAADGMCNLNNSKRKKIYKIYTN